MDEYELWIWTMASWISLWTMDSWISLWITPSFLLIRFRGVSLFYWWSLVYSRYLCVNIMYFDMVWFCDIWVMWFDFELDWDLMNLWHWMWTWFMNWTMNYEWLWIELWVILIWTMNYDWFISPVLIHLLMKLWCIIEYRSIFNYDSWFPLLMMSVTALISSSSMSLWFVVITLSSELYEYEIRRIMYDLNMNL